jgi:hypothetical protein
MPIPVSTNRINPTPVRRKKGKPENDRKTKFDYCRPLWYSDDDDYSDTSSEITEGVAPPPLLPPRLMGVGRISSRMHAFSSTLVHFPLVPL